mmetsp:Transcript_47948/g.113533  ORF Transcript_47948/g.113533 Transcript_47948/m.113533 type:complete len:971 (+) Transcript_47948:388-3300(+)
MPTRMARPSSQMVVLAITLFSLDFAAAQAGRYNSTSLLRVLSTSWEGSGYYEGLMQPLYLHRPEETLTFEDCLPRTGTPSRCPVELMTLELSNEPPPDATEANLNFTMMIWGDVFISSPTAEGFFGMPEKCNYVRNHTIHAEFNASSLEVVFTILATTSDLEECTMSSADQQAPGQRCGGGSCYPDLNGKQFYGLFRIQENVAVPAVDPFTAPYQLDLTLQFPYKHQGSNSWSGYRQIIQENFLPIEETILPDVSAMATDFGDDGRGQIFMYSLTPSPNAWRPRDWFRDRKPYILGATPNYGPEEGGPVVTITGVEFPLLDSQLMNASIVLEHDGEGGQERECCETRRLSDTMVTCKLPRVSCLNEQSPINDCPKPGEVFQNQTVSFSIRPNVQGAQGELLPGEKDDFLQYEGTWVLEDNDVYGGRFVQPADRIPGERHIAQVSQETASTTGCCPVCPAGNMNPACQITISRAPDSPGIYEVTIPSFMSPGSETNPPGICDRATSGRNTSFLAAIERSTDPEGFTPPVPLSITSCIAQDGVCRTVPRISIRETCKQLVWSTGAIRSELPPGQTVEIHEWITNRACDRRMRCIAGRCAWTHLARNPSGNVLQRRTASPQIALEIDYKNTRLDPKLFLNELAPLVGAPDQNRLQVLEFSDGAGRALSTGGSREFQLSDPVQCLPDAPAEACAKFMLSIYVVSDGPNRPDFSVVLGNLTDRAGAQTGDPDLRRLNLGRICIDKSTDPASVVAGIASDCIRIQYPGVLQFEVIDGSIDRRVKEEVWAFARLGVTRTGGSDLGVTVDYRTYDTDLLPLTGQNETRPVAGVDGYFARGSCLGPENCAGLGQDYMSKIGQLRWVEGDSATKHIIIPIYADDITEESETFKVRIFDVVNATDITETATVTIAGINNTPTPRYIQNMQQIIGAVCGAATAVPCALFAARLIRSLRRGADTKKHRTVGKKEEGEGKMAAM